MQEPLVHPTAIISDRANIHPTATVGPYAYIGPQVTLGEGTNVHHHATVDGFTTLGANNQVFSYAYVGGKTHDLKHKGGNPGLKIGDNNTFREYTTVHLATNDNEFTVIGNNNNILAYSHIAHDCSLGNNIVMSSHSALAGHVLIEDHVNIGWNTGVHQFCNVGAYAMLGGCSKIVQTVFPYMLADGNPASIRTINKIGLERNGFTPADIEKVRAIYSTLYRKGLNRTQALDELKASQSSDNPFVAHILEFAQKSKRGLI